MKVPEPAELAATGTLNHAMAEDRNGIGERQLVSGEKPREPLPSLYFLRV